MRGAGLRIGVVHVHRHDRDRQHLVATIQREVHFGVHPGYQDQARVGNVYLRVHGSSGDRNFLRESRDSARETAVQRRHLDLHLLADVHGGDGGFRHRQDQAQQAVLGKLDDRHGLRLRGRSSLNHGTGVRVPLGNHPGERRGNPGVVHQGLHLLRVGRVDVHLFLGRSQGGFCRGNLRFSDQIPALGFVDLLLRDQPGLLFRHCGDALKGEMSDAVYGLRATLFVLGPGDFRPGAHDRCIRPPQVVGHFGNLQGGQKLALLHAIADIDVDLFNKSGDLRHHVDFLVRLEFGSQHQAVREVLRGHLGDCHGRDVGRLGCCWPARARASNRRRSGRPLP